MSDTGGRPRGRAKGRARAIPGSSEGLRQPGMAPPGQPYQQQQQGGPYQQQQQQGAPYQQHQQGPSYHQQQAPADINPALTARGRAAQQHAQQIRKQPDRMQDVAAGVSEATGAFRGLQIGESGGGGQRRGNMRGMVEVGKPPVTKPATCGVKQGSSGTACRIRSNHFKLVKTTDWSLYQYRVDFSPEEDRTIVRKAMLRNHRSLLGEAYMFDGSMLFTIRRLPKDVTEIFSERETDKQKICITVKFTNELAIGDYQYIQLFNIIIRSFIAAMDFQQVGREYFDPKQKVELRNFKLEIWPGYVTSVLQYENDIMMCVDVSHKVLRKDTVLDLILDCRQRCKKDDDWKAKFSEAIVGTTVFTHYNNKPYRVDDVDFNGNPNSTFKKGNTDVSYRQYYSQRYGLTINNLVQPLLVSKPKAKDIRGGRNQNILLIPELCNMTGLSNEMRSNFNLMRAVADKTRIPPAERIKEYEAFYTRLSTNKTVQDTQKKWNIMFAPKLEEFKGRRLMPEKLTASGEAQYGYDDTGDWTKSMRGFAMLKSEQLYDWVVIGPPLLRGRNESGLLNNFLSELNKAARSIKFEIGRPEIEILDSDKPAAYYSKLEQYLGRKAMSLVMCIIPNNKPDVYASIKKKCCIDRPVASQVITMRTLNHRSLLSVATKIVIQLNCKLGGAPWCTPIPFKTEDKKPDATMVVGFDVCHEGGIVRGRSYGAVVCSVDYYFTKFYSAVTQHAFGEELSNDIALHISHAVLRYKEVNGKLPSRIIIYRDGVGESNVPFVLSHEVEMIKNRLNDLFPQAQIKMAVIIVTKRIQTRFFVDNDNPKPGTIVDDVITQPERYDFFLVSQSVKQGTVMPTHYNVIYDTTQIRPDNMQRMTYKMTHLYYNCSATVRVPAQVQYAHKLAFLVGQALQNSPSPDLNDRLYFL